MRSIRMASLCAVLALAVSSRAQASEVEVPVDFGIAPTALFITGPVMDDQLLHTALKLDLYAVITQDVIRKNANRIPPQYRQMASQVKGARIYRPGPLILLPDTLIISPKYNNTGIYGATWKPLGIGLDMGSDAAALSLQLGLVASYMFIYSDNAAIPTTHFIRPGLEARLDLQLMAGKSFGISLGWASQFYVPQEVGSFNVTTDLTNAIWHVGQAYLMFHFRFPYRANM